MLFSAIYQQVGNCGEHLEGEDILWLIDEPEMHMHPELSRSFIDELNEAMRQFKSAGLLNTCQLILATHSPFIVQNSGNYDKTLFTLVEKQEHHTITKDFMSLSELRFPGETELSFSLILYKVFDIPTVELHNEPYGKLQSKIRASSIRKFDRALKNMAVPQNMLWTEEQDETAQTPYPVTLETYIRNSIHHPENKINKYTSSDLRKSIDEMLTLLKKLQK